MADYSVDIAVAVKGSQQLKKLRTEISNTSKELTVLNKLANKQSKTLPNSFQTLNKLVKQVKNNFDRAAIGTKRYNDAAKQLVNVEAKYNNELRKREKLLNRLRQQRPFETVQGKNVMASREARKGSGFADFSRSTTEKADLRRVENNTKTTAKKTSLMATLLTQQAAASNFDRLGGRGSSFFNNLGIGRNANEQGMFAMPGGAAQRKRGAAQSAMIGGGFPLLFGSGVPGAIAGGIGGAAGGALAPGGGFAGSILATAIVAQTQKVMAFRREVKEMNMAIRATGNESIISREEIKKLAKELKISPEKALEELEKFEPKRFGDVSLKLKEAFGARENMDLIMNLKDVESLTKSILESRNLIGEATANELINSLKVKDASEVELDFLNKILDVQRNITKERNQKPGFSRKDTDIIFKGMRDPEVFKLFTESLKASGDEMGALIEQFNPKNMEFFYSAIRSNTDFMLELEKLGGEKKLKESFLNFALSSDQVDKLLPKVKELKKLRAEGIAADKKATDELTRQINEFFKIVDENAEKMRFIPEFDAVGQELKDLMNPMRQVLDLSKAIKVGFEDSFKGIIKGTMSVSDAFRSMLNRIADYFLDTAAQLLALQVQKSFLGLFGNMFTLGDPTSVFKGAEIGSIPELAANGGPVGMRKPYVVGERGPELFVPNQSANIIPNHDLAGIGGGSTNIVVNVDASGSSVEGDEEQGRELGRLISVAVQSEIVQQKRPGGLLA